MVFRIEWSKGRAFGPISSPPRLLVIGSSENAITETEAIFCLRHDTIGREEPGERVYLGCALGTEGLTEPQSSSLSFLW